MSAYLQPVYRDMGVNSPTKPPPPYPSTPLQGRKFSLNELQFSSLAVLITGIVVGAGLGTWFGIDFGADPFLMGCGLGIPGCFAGIGAIGLIASTILKRSSG